MRRLGDTYEMEQKRELLKRIEEAIEDAETKVRRPSPLYALTPQQAYSWLSYCKAAAAQVRSDLERLSRMH